MGTLSIGVFSSLVGSMSYDFALKLANTAADKGHKVNLWFSGNAAASPLKGQKHLKDYSHGEKPLRAALEKGVEVCTCEACSLSRGLKKPESIEGVQWNAMHWYLAKIYSSDRVLHVGGE